MRPARNAGRRPCDRFAVPEATMRPGRYCGAGGTTRGKVPTRADATRRPRPRDRAAPCGTERPCGTAGSALCAQQPTICDRPTRDTRPKRTDCLPWSERYAVDISCQRQGWTRPASPPWPGRPPTDRRALCAGRPASSRRSPTCSSTRARIPSGSRSNGLDPAGVDGGSYDRLHHVDRRQRTHRTLHDVLAWIR
jgi:hypothetical protein